MNKLPVENVDGKASKEDILKILNKYGIRQSNIGIWGSGKPKREFLWSEDMPDTCIYLMENEVKK